MAKQGLLTAAVVLSILGGAQRVQAVCADPDWGVDDNFLLCGVQVGSVSESLVPGTPVPVSFSYTATNARPLWLTIRFFSEGTEVSDSTRFAQQLERGRDGMVATVMTVASGQITVDEVRFALYDLDTGDLMGTYSERRTLPFGYSAQVSNIGLSHAQGSCVAEPQVAEIVFDYTATERVVITAFPSTDGDLTPQAVTDSEIVTVGHGTLTLSAGTTARPEFVDAIGLRMESAATGEVLLETSVAVDHRYGICNGKMTNIQFEAPPGSCLPPNEWTHFSFDYESPEPFRVLIDTLVGDDRLVSVSSLKDGGAGTATAEFAVLTPKQVQRVQISMVGSESGETLTSSVWTVDYDVGDCDRPQFRRGDANSSGIVDISDAVAILDGVYLGGDAIRCREAADADHNAEVDLTDALVIIEVLFAGNEGVAGVHWNECALDPDPVGSAGDLGCAFYDACAAATDVSTGVPMRLPGVTGLPTRGTPLAEAPAAGVRRPAVPATESPEPTEEPAAETRELPNLPGRTQNPRQTALDNGVENPRSVTR